MFGRSSVGNDKDFVIQIFHKKIFFFAQIGSKVFLKHLPGHEESIGLLVDKISQGTVLEKSGQQTDRHTDMVNYYMDLYFFSVFCYF